MKRTIEDISEKYGSALDNPSIYTKELIHVIDEVVDIAVDKDKPYLSWERFVLPYGIGYAKVYYFEDTSWLSAL